MYPVLNFCILIYSFTPIFASPTTTDNLSTGTYSSIELLPEYPFGYYKNASEIELLFKKHDIRIVIEVGSWIGGGSTRHIGNLLKSKQGKLYAIDTWLGSSTQQPNQEHYQPILPQVYQQFLSNMIHWDLTDTVIPIRMDSLTAAKTLQVQPDLIYIDAEHTATAVYADLCAWYPFVEDKGILCGDDWIWTSVQEAVKRFAEENRLQIKTSGNFWILFK